LAFERITILVDGLIT